MTLGGNRMDKANDTNILKKIDQDNRLIKFAKVGDKTAYIDNIIKGMEARCLHCNEILILKDGKVNIKHLAHSQESKCAYKDDRPTKAGVVESYEHKFIKLYIKDNLGRHFTKKGCELRLRKNKLILHGEKSVRINSISTESRDLKNALDLKTDYIPDILLKCDKEYIAIEIYKTNRKNQEQLKELLEDKNIYVYEIDVNTLPNLNINTIHRHMKLIYSPLKSKLDEYNKHLATEKHKTDTFIHEQEERIKEAEQCKEKYYQAIWECEEVKSKYKNLKECFKSLGGSHKKLKEKYEELKMQIDRKVGGSEYDKLEGEYKALEGYCQTIENFLEELKEGYYKLEKENEELKEKLKVANV